MRVEVYGKSVKEEGEQYSLDVAVTFVLKGPSRPPPFSMTSKLLIKHGEANSYCFTVSCVPEGMFNYLE